jgi:antitoxin (DNA-binding transcriptional repressor) of toxin-antitoxin stability system
MKFVTIRDLRSKSAQIRRNLPKEKEMILTANGNPIAILTAVSEDNMEDVLNAFRRVRAVTAVSSIQKRSCDLGKSHISFEEINEEIHAVRKMRKKK